MDSKVLSLKFFSGLKIFSQFDFCFPLSDILSL